MGSCNFVKDVEKWFGPEHYVVDLSLIRTEPDVDKRVCRVSPALFAALDDYTNSCPTSPSSGRVYKNLGWGRLRHTWVGEWQPALANHGFEEDKPEDWWVYFVRNDYGWKPGKKYQAHHPFRLVVDDALPAH